MEDIFIYRSLLFAVIEYILCAIVLYKGKNFKYPLAAVLFFLASYQLGEFIFLKTGLQFALQFAIFSTTLLPPFGMYLVQYNSDKKYFYYISQVIGLGFALLFLFVPGYFEGAARTFCLVKLYNIDSIQVHLWIIYYIVTLSITMIMAVVNIIKEKRIGYKRFNIFLLISYTTFFPLSYILVLCSPEFQPGDLASLMCALAIMAAFILTWVATRLKINE